MHIPPQCLPLGCTRWGRWGGSGTSSASQPYGPWSLPDCPLDEPSLSACGLISLQGGREGEEEAIGLPVPLGHQPCGVEVLSGVASP